jgi:hypothetical protein
LTMRLSHHFTLEHPKSRASPSLSAFPCVQNY